MSIHAPATAETRNLIDRKALAAMKPSAWLINTSRGALVDEPALIEALRNGAIAGAALDVLAQEPPDPANPLLAMPNVLVTPHAAFSSQEALEDLQRRACQRVIEGPARRAAPAHRQPAGAGIPARSVPRRSCRGCLASPCQMFNSASERNLDHW